MSTDKVFNGRIEDLRLNLRIHKRPSGILFSLMIKRYYQEQTPYVKAILKKKKFQIFLLIFFIKKMHALFINIYYSNLGVKKKLNSTNST